MAKKHKKHEEEEHADETWLVPYSDVLTLLLALFIVLFASSRVDVERFQQMSESFQRVFNGSGANTPAGILPGESSITPLAPPSRVGQQQQQSMTNEKMNAVLNAFIEDNRLQELVTIKQTKSGFTVRILDSALFDKGSDRILPSAIPILNQVAEIAKESPYYVSIEGHTDDLPISLPGSNWKLSTDRALSVLTHMYSRGVRPDRLSAVGFGEYHPLLPNITDENRAQNRRVEINFISSQYFDSTHYPEFN